VWEELFMTRRLLAVFFGTALAFALAAQAADTKKPDRPDGPKVDPKAVADDAALQQDELRRRFDDFKAALVRVAQRLENTGKAEDREKAKQLRAAIEKSSQQGIESKFLTLIAVLKEPGTFKSIQKLGDAAKKNEELRSDLALLIDMLLRDDRDEQLRKEKERIARLLEQLKEIIGRQERVRSQTEQARLDKNDLGKNQKDVTQATAKLGKADKNGENKHEKSEAKYSTNKNGDKGEAKPDTKDNKGENRSEGKPNTEGNKTNDNKPSSENKPGGDKGDKNGNPSENKGDKGDKTDKPGEGKGNDQKPGEGKPSEKGSKENKPSDGKGDGKKSDGNKPSDGKGNSSKEGGKPSDGKGADKPGEGKGSESKGGDGKPGDSKGGDSKGGDGKPGDGKGGQSKEGGKPSDGKGGDGGSKPGDAKGGEPKDNGGKGGDSKPGDSAGGKGKPGENKEGSGLTKPASGKTPEGSKDPGKPGQPKAGGDPKKGNGPASGEKNNKPNSNPSEAKGGAGKPGAPAPTNQKGTGDGKGDAKGAGKPSEGGKPSQGGQKGSQGGKPSGQKGDPSQGGQGGQQGDQKPDDNPIKKQIQEGNKYQGNAEDEIAKGNNKKASDDQDKAIEELKKAQKTLEELLKQLREEETERLLAKLQERCEYMLRMQKQVYAATKSIHGDLKGRKLDSLDGDERQVILKNANKQRDTENDIVKEANEAIRMIQAEGTAIAFAEVFRGVRSDMQNVSTRLGQPDVGEVTQAIEQDIIAALQDMIEALKKAREENKDQKGKPGQPGQKGPPADPKLLDTITELKLILSRQIRVNDRTQLYAKQYKGEQAVKPENMPTDAKEKARLDNIQNELQELSGQQKRIGKVTNDLYKGKNKAQGE
jgi:hypothetical protein